MRGREAILVAVQGSGRSVTLEGPQHKRYFLCSHYLICTCEPLQRSLRP